MKVLHEDNAPGSSDAPGWTKVAREYAESVDTLVVTREVVITEIGVQTAEAELARKRKRARENAEAIAASVTLISHCFSYPTGGRLGIASRQFCPS